MIISSRDIKAYIHPSIIKKNEEKKHIRNEKAINFMVRIDGPINEEYKERRIFNIYRFIDISESNLLPKVYQYLTRNFREKIKHLTIYDRIDTFGILASKTSAEDINNFIKSIPGVFDVTMKKDPNNSDGLIISGKLDRENYD